LGGVEAALLHCDITAGLSGKCLCLISGATGSECLPPTSLPSSNANVFAFEDIGYLVAIEASCWIITRVWSLHFWLEQQTKGSNAATISWKCIAE
jgi:hypothetical protein